MAVQTFFDGLLVLSLLKTNINNKMDTVSEVYVVNDSRTLNNIRWLGTKYLLGLKLS